MQSENIEHAQNFRDSCPNSKNMSNANRMLRERLEFVMHLVQFEIGESGLLGYAVYNECDVILRCF